MKKIVFFFNYPKNEYFGGIANIISNYISNSNVFNEHDFDVVYLNPDISLSKNRFYSCLQKIFFLSAEKKKIRQFFRSCKFVDIFHIHSSRGWILYNDLKLAKYIKKHFRIPVVLSIHFADLGSILVKWPFRKKEIQLLKCIDHIITLSEKTKKELTEKDLSQSKISVLYTFHSFQEQINSDSVLSHVPTRLLFMGSIDERKGILDLTSALCSLKDDVVLNVCGGFTDEKFKERLESIFSADRRITFKGYVEGSEKEEIFKSSDIFVLPSYGEGMPIVIMEALYFGCAIVSTNVGAIPEIVHEENGRLVEPGNIDALSFALHSLISNQKVLNEIKKNNIVLGAKYSLKENIDSLCDIYRRILDVK